MDPKVTATGITLADLKAQEALNLKVRDQRTLAKQTLNNLQKNKEKLTKLAITERSKSQQKQLEALEELETIFATEKGRYQKPMLLDQFRYLNYMIAGADQKPGDDAYQRLEELSDILKKQVDKYRAVAKIKGGSADMEE